MRSTLGIFLLAAGLATAGVAQNRPLSPAGAAAIQVGGEYKAGPGGRAPSYQGGHWIEITYGRPILRGRKNFFGSGEDYGKQALAGAPVWRVGANVSTRLNTEVDLMIGGKRIPAGEYSLFVDLKSPSDWTFIVSSWGAQQSYNPKDKENLWGAYGYTPDKDVVRTPMTVSQTEHTTEQLTIGFLDVTDSGGTIAVWWDKNMATVPFELAK